MNKKLFLVLLVAAVLLLVILIYTASSQNISQTDFTVTTLDIGKADCIILQMKEKTILIDTGYAENAIEILAFLHSKSIEQIDYLVITHYDKDHVGSAAQIINSISVNEVLRPDYIEESDQYVAFIEALSTSGVKDTVLKVNMAFTWEDTSITVYAPQEETYDDDNNYSLILSLTYKDFNFLFAGDALNKRLNEFLDNNTKQYDFIKIPHHGAYQKAYKELIETSTPSYAVITCSYQENAEQKLLDVLDENKVKTYLTEKGTVVIHSDGSEITVTQ